MINNLVVKIQNLFVNHESRPIISNPAPRCRGQHLADVNIFYTSVVISVNFKNHASVIIISQCIGEFSSVSLLDGALFCIMKTEAAP